MEDQGFFLICNIMSFTNMDNLTSFLVLMPFMSSFSLMAVAKTSTATRNKNGKSGQLCLAADWGEMPSAFLLPGAW